MRITISKEKYLKAIAEAEGEGEVVIAATLARWLKVSPPAVTMAIRRLKRDGLIRLTAAGEITLAREGREIANRVMNRHIEQFWHKRPEWVAVDGKKVAFISALLDTTFAVHRPGHPFRRLKTGLRVYHPYEARHLDWYPEEGAPDGSVRRGHYGESSSVDVSHWGNRSYFSEHASEPPAYEKFIVVDGNPAQERTHRVEANPL